MDDQHGDLQDQEDPTFEENLMNRIKAMKGASGRHVLSIILGFNCLSDEVNCSKAVDEERPTQIFIAAVNGSEGRRNYIEDLDLPLEHSLFVKEVVLGFSGESDVSTWIGKMVVPWLLFTKLNLEWEEASVTTLCKLKINGFTELLFKHYWHALEPWLRQELEVIVANPNKLFCKRCPQSCELRRRPWHLNLEDFFTLKFVPEYARTRFGVFDNFDFLHTTNDIGSRVLLDLRNLPDERTTLEGVFQSINRTVDLNFTNSTYHTYLVMLLDGPNMPVERPDTESYLEYLRQEEVVVSLYGGIATNAAISMHHFGRQFDQSAIGKILTSTTRMYVLRSKQFNSRVAAALDEAITIEILKGLFHHRREMSAKPTYFILNSRSELQRLYSDTGNAAEHGIRFILSGIPLIKVDANMYEEYTATFSGNFIPEPFAIPGNEGYDERTFADVEDEYLIIFGRAPK